VTGPTTSSHDCVYRVSGTGQVDVFYRGLGRPQGLAFDSEGNLLVVASLNGRRGVVSGQHLVGLAFAPKPLGGLVLATGNALFHLNWPTAGFSVRT
jgi:sugar lactone lactonase YvrE